MGLRESVRTPVLVALLAFLPAYFVGVFVFVLPASSVPLEIPGGGTGTVTTAALFGLLVVPLLAGLVGGLVGLFLVRTGREADARLVLAGYRPWQVLASRFALLVPAGLVTTGVSLAILSVETVPERLGWFVLAALLAGLIYGCIGMLAGLVLSRLAGVYLVLFVPMIDVVFFQNPLVGEYHDVAPYLPGHAVTRLAMDAGFSESVALDALGGAVAYLFVVACLATAGFYRSISRG